VPKAYEVVLRRSAKKGWQDICRRDPTGAADAYQHLRTTPALHAPGKVKKLRGKWAGLLQYRVNRSDRLQYWVDEDAGVVYVEYAGPHP